MSYISNGMEAANGEIAPMPMWEYSYPDHAYPFSCIVAPTAPTVNIFRMQMNISNSLPRFHGIEHEHPYKHVAVFKAKLGTLSAIAQSESAWVTFFSLSLRDSAKTWLNSLNPQSVLTWDDLINEFYKNFIPIFYTGVRKKQIQIFSERELETISTFQSQPGG
jgi:hypothetical protein